MTKQFYRRVKVTEGNLCMRSIPWPQSWEERATPLVPVYQEPIRNRGFMRNKKQHKRILKSNVPWHQFSCSVMSDSLRPHGLQHARLPCPSPTPRAYSNSCPTSWWCHPTISSSIVCFCSRLQSFSKSGSLPISWFFTSGGQSIGASASVLPTYVLPIYDWFMLMSGKIQLNIVKQLSSN